MKADYEKIIRACIEPLLSNPTKLVVEAKESKEEAESTHDLHFLIACPGDELGKLIGRHGSVADAIRTIVNIKGRDEKKRVHIKFEATDAQAE